MPKEPVISNPTHQRFESTRIRIGPPSLIKGPTAHPLCIERVKESIYTALLQCRNFILLYFAKKKESGGTFLCHRGRFSVVDVVFPGFS